MPVRFGRLLYAIHHLNARMARIMMVTAVLTLHLQWQGLSLMMAAQVLWILLRQPASLAVQRCKMSWEEAAGAGHAQQRVIQLVAWSVGSGILRIRIAAVRQGIGLNQSRGNVWKDTNDVMILHPVLMKLQIHLNVLIPKEPKPVAPVVLKDMIMIIWKL